MSAQNGPLITSAEALRVMRQQKYNPMRTLKPATLARALEAFAIGYLREGAILFEEIADRDDTLKSVKPKREKEVSQLDKQVVALPGSGDAGEQQREVLEDFWNNVRAVNSYDRNERGGFRRLVKQMMSAVSFRYAQHHIVWRPSNGRLHATFEFVPLWLFENRTGSLRYLRDPFSQDGEVLDPSEWMVTYGDGLMIACSIGFLAKRSAFNDWLIFSEKFSVPGVLGRTSSGKDTPEGQAMRAAVESFGHDWTGVIYGDDGTHDKPIEIIQAAGNPSGMPMPAVVERVDRKFAALYRGADLSTMSAGGGEGTGASLQGDEKNILLADDAETITETLADVSRMVLEWHFGRGVEILAKVQLMVPQDEDEKFYLESVKALKDMGVRISKDAVLERLGIQEADEGEIALGEVKAETLKEDLGNALETEDFETEDRRLDEEMQALRMALAADLKPLGDALFAAYQAGDAPAMTAALKKISAGMPDLAGDAAALSEELGGRMVAAFLGDDAEEVANAGFNQSQPRLHGKWTGTADGGGGSKSRKVDSIPEVVHAAFYPSNQTFCDWADVSATDVELIKREFGMDLTGGKRVLVADEVRKILRDHGADPLPVTYQDFEALPHLMAARQRVLTSSRPGKHPRIISLIPQGNTTVIVEEVRTGRNKLAVMSLYKVPGEDLEKTTRTLRAIPEGKPRADG